MTAATVSVRDGNRRHGCELDRRTEAKRDRNHWICAPELQPTDHGRKTGKQFVGESSHVLIRTKITDGSGCDLPTVIKHFKMDLERGVVGICNGDTGAESIRGIDEHGLL